MKLNYHCYFLKHCFNIPLTETPSEHCCEDACNDSQAAGEPADRSWELIRVITPLCFSQECLGAALLLSQLPFSGLERGIRSL